MHPNGVGQRDTARQQGGDVVVAGSEHLHQAQVGQLAQQLESRTTEVRGDDDRHLAVRSQRFSQPPAN